MIKTRFTNDKYNIQKQCKYWYVESDVGGKKFATLTTLYHLQRHSRKDGMLCLSDDSFSSNAFEQLVLHFLCTS